MIRAALTWVRLSLMLERPWRSYVTASPRAGGRCKPRMPEPGAEQPHEQKWLPKWESLGIEMREALIFVYFQGRIDARVT